MYKVEICLTSMSNLNTVFLCADKVSSKDVSILFSKSHFAISQSFFDAGTFTISDFIDMLLTSESSAKLSDFVECNPDNSIYFNVVSACLY